MKQKRLSLFLACFTFLAIQTGFAVVFKKQCFEDRMNSILKEENIRLDHATQKEIAHTVFSLSESYAMDPFLILAIIKVESRFKLKSRSGKSAYGLMQIRSVAIHDVMDDLHFNFDEETDCYHDIEGNLSVGVHYFSNLLKRFHGDLPKALMAYNAGPTTVARLYGRRSVPYRGYQKKVLETYIRMK